MPPPTERRVYFDNAATTPLDDSAFRAMEPILTEVFGNPSSIHANGRKAKTVLEQSRKTVAKLLNVSASEIIFTSGGTESNNTAIRMAVKSLGVKNIITTPIEHHSVLYTIKELAHKNKVKVHFLEVNKDGEINLDELEQKLIELPNSFVNLMHANNEIGTLNDIEKIGNICKLNNALFHSDTVQTIGHIPIDLKAFNIDFAVGSAHKFNGPKGVGFLYVSKKNKIAPFITGGNQERGHRAGTENIAGIVGMAKALEISVSSLQKDQKHIEKLKNKFKDLLIQNFSDIGFVGSKSNSLYSILNVSFPAVLSSDLFLFKLDLHGISVSAGSACSSGANKGSHVLEAIGADTKRNYIRFSFGKFNIEEELNIAIEKIKEILYEE